MQSLIELIESAVRRYGERTAYVCMGCTMRFHDLGVRSAAFGRWLISLGLAPDARIAVMLPNVFQQPIAVAGVLRSGRVLVNVNPLYTPRELAEQLNDSGASVLVVLENFAHVVQKAQTGYGLPHLRHVVITELGDEMGVKGRLINLAVRHLRRMVPAWSLPASMTVMRWKALVRIAPSQSAGSGAASHASSGSGFEPGASLAEADGKLIARRRDDLALLQYTGGTTGLAKGAMLTHGNLLANLDQCASWLEPEKLEQQLIEQRKDKRSGPDRGDGNGLDDGRVEPSVALTMVAALPLYHIFSFTACMMLGFQFGFKNLLLPNPRDLKSVIDALSKDPAHLFPAVNTLFNALLHHPDFSRMDFSELMITVGGGMAVSESVAHHWKARTGCVMLEGYGLSETSPVVSATPRSLQRFTGSVGLAMPGTEICLLDEQGHRIHDPAPRDAERFGTAGEIAVRGPQLMRGYWNQRPEEDDSFTSDGFFKTGDIGAFDAEGFLHILDRKKDMILVSGFNVYPTEIERVVSQHPAVRECAAVGMPDEYTGEAVRLFVVLSDAAAGCDLPNIDASDRVDAEVMKAWCKERLTNYKRPRDVIFVESLPKTNVGKVLRRALRDVG